MKVTISKSRLILSRTADVMLSDAGAIILTVALLTIITSPFDAYGDQKLANMLGSIGSFVSGAVLTFRALQKTYPASGMSPRLVGLFGLSLLSSVATLAGIILFILPGIFLYIRWFVSWPLFIRSGESVIEALKRSWLMMRGWEWAAVLIIGTSLLALMVFVVTLTLIAGSDGSGNLIVSVLFNLGFYSWYLFTCLLAVSCFLVAESEQSETDKA